MIPATGSSGTTAMLPHARATGVAPSLGFVVPGTRPGPFATGTVSSFVVPGSRSRSSGSIVRSKMRSRPASGHLHAMEFKTPGRSCCGSCTGGGDCGGGCSPKCGGKAKRTGIAGGGRASGGIAGGSVQRRRGLGGSLKSLAGQPGDCWCDCGKGWDWVPSCSFADCDYECDCYCDPPYEGTCCCCAEDLKFTDCPSTPTQAQLKKLGLAGKPDPWTVYFKLAATILYKETVDVTGHCQLQWWERANVGAHGLPPGVWVDRVQDPKVILDQTKRMFYDKVGSLTDWIHHSGKNEWLVDDGECPPKHDIELLDFVEVSAPFQKPSELDIEIRVTSAPECPCKCKQWRVRLHMSFARHDGFDWIMGPRTTVYGPVCENKPLTGPPTNASKMKIKHCIPPA